MSKEEDKPATDIKVARTLEELLGKQATKISQEETERQERLMRNLNDLAEGFVKEPMKSRVSIEGLYTDVVWQLENAKAITPEQSKYMTDENKGFMKEHVDKAEKLLKTNLKGCSTGDKIKYRIADFCNNIGLKTIGSSLMEKVSTKGRTKIALAESQIVKNIVENIGQSFGNTEAKRTKIDPITAKLKPPPLPNKKQTGGRGL